MPTDPKFVAPTIKADTAVDAVMAAGAIEGPAAHPHKTVPPKAAARDADKPDTAIGAVMALEGPAALPHKTGPPEDGIRIILRWPEVHRRTGRSRTSAWRDARKGKFPAPVEIGDNAIGWFEDEIAAWLEARPRTAYAA